MNLIDIILVVNLCYRCHNKEIEDILKNSAHRNLDCISCHEGFEKFPHPKKKVRCKICHGEVAKFFERSVHYDKLGCSDCHGKHRITVFEIYTKKLSISDICAGCHTEEGNNYKNSIHYLALKKGANDAPSCVDCHSEHHVLSSETEGSPVYYKNVPKTCAQCHENKAITDKYGISPRRLSSYLSSYHGIFLEKGIPYVANCISCHTPHFILPAEDKRSSIHPDNLPKTCSKCHPKADFSVTKGKIHIEVKPQSAPHVFAVRVFYIIFISILVSGFVIHIIFDFIKFIKNRRSHE